MSIIALILCILAIVLAPASIILVEACELTHSIIHDEKSFDEYSSIYFP